MIATDSLARLFAEAAAVDAQPLWTMMDAMVPPRPEPKAVPHVWRYDALRPLLERSGNLVGTEDAERRVRAEEAVDDCAVRDSFRRGSAGAKQQQNVQELPA